MTRPAGNGNTVTQRTSYTPTGQVGSVTEWATDPIAAPAQGYAYNDAGWLTSVSQPSGRTHSYGHDMAGRVTSDGSTGAGAAAVTVQTGYDSLGRPTAVSPNLGDPAVTQSVTYDAAAVSLLGLTRVVTAATTRRRVRGR